MNTVILGSGLPALCAAHTLSNLGHVVTVLEPFGTGSPWDDDAPIFFEAEPGGNATCRKVGGNRFLRCSESIGHTPWLVHRWITQHLFPQGWQAARMESLLRRSYRDLCAMQEQLGLQDAEVGHAGFMWVRRGGGCSLSSVPTLITVADFKSRLRARLVQRGVRFALGVPTGTAKQGRQVQLLTVRVNGGLPQVWPIRWLVLTDWSQAGWLLARDGVKPTLALLSRIGQRLESGLTRGPRSTWCISDERSGYRAIRSRGAGWVYGPAWLGAVPNIGPEMALPLSEFARQALGGEWTATHHRPRVSSTWVSPTGMPLVEQTALTNVYLNLGHSDFHLGSTFGAATWLAEDIERVALARQQRVADFNDWYTTLSQTR